MTLLKIDFIHNKFINLHANIFQHNHILKKTSHEVFMSIRKIPFEFYQIKKGENLKTIAQKYNIDSTKILLDNNISPKQIKEGVFILLKK